ncbi:hypothetical protein CFC21_008811 [Triticum aestivum]|uniref:Uncharacterized protein n=2 Tax=Triticum aestivum TaxID=4565 RepID=A0A9R1ISU2_WHEAT|nr:hypothetical protein CFC21_008811 [Triticum aestivum]
MEFLWFAFAVLTQCSVFASFGGLRDPYSCGLLSKITSALANRLFLTVSIAKAGSIASLKFFCDNCCSLQAEHKIMKIKKPPNILAIHLKHFKYNNLSSGGEHNILFWRFFQNGFQKVFPAAISSIELQLRGKLSGHPSSIAENDMCNHDTMWCMDDIFPRLKRGCLDNQCMEHAHSKFDALVLNDTKLEFVGTSRWGACFFEVDSRWSSLSWK